jgi:type II secretory pathway component PulF
VGVLDTLGLARGSTQNRRFQDLFNQLEQTVTSGGQLSSVFAQTDLVEAHVCQAIHTGEDSGNLGGALTYCADILDETNGELIDTSMRLVEPAILIGMGFVVGAVAISLFLPLFEMTSAMR